MLRALVWLAVAVVTAAFPQARASAPTVLDLLDAPVAYTASFTVTSDRGTYRGTVWHAPGRERRDFDTAGGGQSVLLRRDTGAAYLMKPSGRWYVGLGLDAAAGLAGGLHAMAVTRTPVGEETVAGTRATRYRVEASAPKGGRFRGEAWISRDGILVKAVGDVITPGGRVMPVSTALSGLRRGKVDETRFDLPAGWTGMDLRSVPAERIEQVVESLRPLLEGR